MHRQSRQSEVSPRELSIAIDTGGTFTDCVWVERGRIRMLKVFSTPGDPSQAIAEALRKIGGARRRTLLHGTTVGTNTLLQRKGAKVALVTTAGFEDVIEIGRQARPKLYDFFFDRVEPLVPAECRFGVKERISATGEVLEALDPRELAELVTSMRAKSPAAAAISLLFCFANPGHEQAVASALRALGIPLSVSHEILPEFREYERTSTVVMNAYLQPVMQSYLDHLERKAGSREAAQGQTTRIFVMQSNGGIAALHAAAREPVRTVLSGPAGGVVGAAAMARRSGFQRIISFDMGGTSTDVALVDGEIRTSGQSEVAGLPVGVPMLDIHTAGAGGGSIARFDAGGALRVGPESAGADPGPICYGRGKQPTVTDANLLLGRMQPNRFLGGKFVLDVERTRRMVREWLKKQASTLNLEQFSAGVVRVVNAAMERALRVVSIERGHDPREFALVAFGGAGGLHACELAEALGIPRVMVPALPGALSALGILASDVVRDYSRTVLWRVARQLPAEGLGKEFAGLAARAERDLRAEGWKGNIQLQRSADVRYHGQGYELNVPYGQEMLKAFQKEHQRRYGYSYPEREIELVTLRLRAVIRAPQIKSPLQGNAPAGGKGRAGQAQIFFSGKKIAASLYSREELQAGRRYRGPAVITEYSATTVVPPGKYFSHDRAGNLIIEIL